jgi:hypothetical protein
MNLFTIIPPLIISPLYYAPALKNIHENLELRPIDEIKKFKRVDGRSDYLAIALRLFLITTAGGHIQLQP